MADSSFTPKQFLDYLSEFSAGINSGIAPELLAKNQLAFAINASIRGGFIKPRPPVQVQTLNFGNDEALQTLVETGKFQGGGYYRPDYGPECLIAQISGHLILFTSSGSAWNVSDISIAGDLNSTVPNQVWMWQSEKWMIVQDGTGVLPIFFDGTTSRRSYGPSVLLGTAIAFSPASPPAIGQIETVTLSAPYAGPYNIPVIFNGEYYQPIEAASGYNVTLTNTHATDGLPIPLGSQIIISGSNVGYISALATGHYAGPYLGTNDQYAISFGGNHGLSVGDAIVVPTTGAPGHASGNVTVLAVLSLTQIVTAHPGFGGANQGNFSIGTLVTKTTTTPNSIVGTTTASAVTPAIGASITVSLDQLYTGANGQTIFINGQEFSIAIPSSSGGSTTLMLVNLTDVATTAYVNPETIYSVPEIPAGRMGAYGMGCNACSSVDGLSFIIGDVVGSGAGTQANNYRDAVLKTVSNDFLAGGGSFRLPGTGDIITAMSFPTNLDTSLGQGPLQISTAFSIFSNIVPGTDPSTWSSVTNPIQTESLKDNGPLGQNSTIAINSDTFFRSNVGIGSLVLARRDFNQWGNKSISNEMQRILDADDQSLLSYGSGESFDNRYLDTASPLTISNGIIHSGITSLNLDLISSLRTSLPPSWESLWTGLNVFQMVSGRVAGTLRNFAFTYNFTKSKIELYEMLPEKSAQYLDNGDTRIIWSFETPVLFGPTIKSPVELAQLREGEVYLSNIKGTVSVDVYYRPDYYPCWVLWRSFDVCQSNIPANAKPGYRMRIGLGQPSVEDCEPGNNRPLRSGYFFQCRVVVTGSCTWKGMKASAMSMPQPTFAPVECEAKECQVIDCELPDDLDLYRLQGSQN